MKRVRQFSLSILHKKVRLAIPLYSDGLVGVKFLPSKPIESYNGLRKFNHILIHFGKLLEKLDDIDVRREDLSVILPMKDIDAVDMISEETKKIVHEVSNSETIPVNLAKKYRKLLCQLASIVKKTTNIKEEFPYTFVPLRGGAHVVSSFGINFDSMIAIDCKRIPLKDKSFAFGMHSPVFDPYDLDRINGKKLRVVEVCVASGITSIGILLDLFVKGCVPRVVVFQVLFASTKGLTLIKLVANQLGIDVRFYVGKLYNGLGDLVTSNDSIIDEKKQAVIGNATEILDVATKANA